LSAFLTIVLAKELRRMFIINLFGIKTYDKIKISYFLYWSDRYASSFRTCVL